LVKIDPHFDECLSDIDWLPRQTGIVVLVRDTAQTLVDGPPADMAAPVRGVGSAASAYRQPIAEGEWWTA